jgi:hypothetical protein
MFNGRKLLIATKHNKEEVIAPLFENYLQVECVVATKFDTDLLGTFSGEIERKLDVIETLRQKCLLAIENTTFDLVVASEGSFGSHPTIFFAQADDELMIFKDIKNDIEIIARNLSTDTNFDGIVIKNQKALEDFATKVKFPSHGIILKSSEKNPEIINKDIGSISDLIVAYIELSKQHSTIFAETDMRAFRNPTRMQVIKECVEKLIEKINTLCPSCNFPGFEIKQVNAGLPCELCGSKTKSTLSHTYGCLRCDYKEEKYFPLNKKVEDPTYCDYCNP